MAPRVGTPHPEHPGCLPCARHPRESEVNRARAQRAPGRLLRACVDALGINYPDPSTGTPFPKTQTLSMLRLLGGYWTHREVSGVRTQRRGRMAADQRATWLPRLDSAISQMRHLECSSVSGPRAGTIECAHSQGEPWHAASSSRLTTYDAVPASPLCLMSRCTPCWTMLRACIPRPHRFLDYFGAIAGRNRCDQSACRFCTRGRVGPGDTVATALPTNCPQACCLYACMQD